MPWQGFEPKSVELRRPGAFWRMLYQLSYHAAAVPYKLLTDWEYDTQIQHLNVAGPSRLDQRLHPGHGHGQVAVVEDEREVSWHPDRFRHLWHLGDLELENSLLGVRQVVDLDGWGLLPINQLPEHVQMHLHVTHHHVAGNRVRL